MKSLSCDWQVMFLKACVSWPYFADSAVCEFFKDEFILAKLVYLWDIYMKMSVLIDTMRSHWWCVLLIAGDVSLAGSLISVPDRKAVLWWGSWPAVKMTSSIVHNSSFYLSSQKNYRFGLAFFICIYARTLWIMK